MTTNTPPARNIFDFSVFEAVLYGACGPAVHEPTAMEPENPVEAAHTKGCCGGTNPACRGCDRCGPQDKTAAKP